MLNDSFKLLFFTVLHFLNVLWIAQWLFNLNVIHVRDLKKKRRGNNDNDRNISLSQKHRTVGLNRWKLNWTDVLVGKIGPDVRWLRWLGFKFYFPYYWILLPPAIFNANDFVPEVCGRRKHATIKRKTMRKTGSQDFLTSGGGRDGVWAFVQDIVQITQRILKSCYIGWMAVDEKSHFQKV